MPPCSLSYQVARVAPDACASTRCACYLLLCRVPTNPSFVVAYLVFFSLVGLFSSRLVFRSLNLSCP